MIARHQCVSRPRSSGRGSSGHLIRSTLVGIGLTAALTGCSAAGLLGGTDAMRAQPWPPPGGMGPSSAAPSAVSAQTEATTQMAATRPVATIRPVGEPSSTPTPRQPSFEARFVADVTLPDHSRVASGASVTKTWRVTNTGSTAWTVLDALVLEEKAGVQAPERVPLPPTAPGATATISVIVKMPAKPGAVAARWRLEANGVPFGPPLWLSVDIQPPGTTPTAAAAPSMPRPATFTPKPAATATFAPKPVATPVTYTVRKGDTLYSVARRYHLTPAELARANYLDDPEHLLVGQVLRVPEAPVHAADAKP